MTIRTHILTGITTTGTPHLGNYAGVIRPAIIASQDANTDSFYFLADYHALIKCNDPQRTKNSRMQIAATWLACGLDVNKVTFYRQSDIPEILELTWLLTCIASKGLLNRAHAYKASVDRNIENGEDQDAGISMGLYSYPVLMAADILMFNAHKVLVGRDQIQHIEMARDIGQRFNHLFGKGKECFTIPEALIENSVATLPGLDGRKMSKSYGNTIPLFTGAKDMMDAILRIVTDSSAPGKAKNPDSSHLFTLFQAFASKTQKEEFRAELLQGLSWSEAKNRLFQLLDCHLGEARERYHQLMSRPSDMEDFLLLGAKKARAVAIPFLAEIREAVGICSFVKQTVIPIEAKRNPIKVAHFVSFRENDGSFRFRLLAADGEQLLLSCKFVDGKAANAGIKHLQSGNTLDLRIEATTFSVWLSDVMVACSATFADNTSRDMAITSLRVALASIENYQAKN
ncbi:tryptophan--tRNA ligase [Candidatus Pseudomonas adelgestsugas]|uniref:Tryptophan--tRNA ligase n=1 Tax=Candidatus Pseudomonas adelgestsugas TaxID=1302376 RepID=A0ABX5R8A4_9PSED|nr:tryptophan--tRNA ligase [Candidatus Pseudomonas adelgestsugas]QAX81875.1 Tryptophan--tRNA ligase [Candidatus Pseudomonas adelgestsugas]